MPGRSTESDRLRYVGLAAFVVAAAGAVLLDWNFATDESLPTALGVGAALLAVVWTLLRD